eukprot:CAMPEP_0184522340 /NCGR_PEP_ID=MMETSP0198_2-20121128/8228_1 /TAXON_ID=1112570 /ORGANISM="Thraustochytrium sp., Strain LLF1b" /LENGTH=295 /DNA_ID=CAMNT_0026913157 /DNA_START=65 /DNA_END=952 /DNA_ORIENTATION=+
MGGGPSPDSDNESDSGSSYMGGLVSLLGRPLGAISGRASSAEPMSQLGRVEANRLAKEAQEAESFGLVDVAVEKYRDAAQGLMEAAHAVADSNEVAALKLQAGEYLARMGQLNDTSRGAQGTNALGVPRDANFQVSDDKGDVFTPEEVGNGAALVGSGLGSVAGSALGMPIIGGIAGLFTANHFVHQESEVGAGTRAMGVIGARLIRAAKRANDEHDFTGNIEKVARSAASKAAETNEEYDITGKLFRATSGFGMVAFEKAREWNQEYKVVDRLKDVRYESTKASNESPEQDERP